ncbi:MAG TPA: 4'-phosphopantetheinyl transferase superfamily protein [Pyrinomonadaceae bacterium]|nr:4'-phosphopantetheinyl transferase superfamily protein [Pyrinomonadaceae bacterium]
MLEPGKKWRLAPRRLTLERDAVHVWKISLAQPRAPSRTLWNLLAPDERARAKGFHYPRHRDRFIVARGALRTILAGYIKAPAASLVFDHGPFGKPSLIKTVNPEWLCFNLSYSHEIALCAVTKSREVGIDIEFMREDFSSLDTAKRFFSRAEVAALCELPKRLQTIAFFHCWTRKEAYIKARGEGLSRPLDRFTVSLVPGRPAQLLENVDLPEETLRWKLDEIPIEARYVAAIALEAAPFTLYRWNWTNHEGQ